MTATIPAARATTLQPRDALDPIATPEPGDCPVFDRLFAAFKRAGLADHLVTAEHAAKTPRRDARGRFTKAGRS